MTTKKAKKTAAGASEVVVAHTDQPKPEPKQTEPKKAAAKLRESARVLRKHGIVQKAEELEREADALDPRPEKKAKEPKQPRAVCSSTKKNGEPCTARVLEGKTYCTDHRPALDHLTDEERSTFLRFVDESATDDLAAWLCEQIGWGRVKKLASAL